MTTQMTLNLVEGSVRFNFPAEAARKLEAALAELMASLKAIATAKAGASSKPKPEKSLEYQHTGDVFLEVFCNPNIWPTPFAAKLLITLRDDRIRLTTEAELTRVLEDLNQHLDQIV
ncbi:MAG: hypothetical protein HC886_11875 [Leptolyngbyaceae cyanobacterium SM1_1_3]|nr:hypothetical protein [Leptolyngbyaceae cyanobacterium SM1_1_3]NJN01830.1 hypothetical protein [Leptolyngbyaceae cyanobacterium RM1_1_2]NJO10643.1 hypothetical protein [Leptolyngbyaceae cyanobacterium SL_1_1]